MRNHGRCKNVREVITKEACEEQQERGARICRGCPGPMLPADPAPTTTPKSAEPYETLAKEFDHLSYQSCNPVQPVEVVAAPSLVIKDLAPGKIIVVPNDDCRPGFFVDFTGHEDLMTEFCQAACKAGMTPGESALDLIYLFVEGKLRMSGKL